ncbi:or S-antigen, C-terminal domain-domain-containing protein [Naematelia encephala]|uniref:Or S-antigen, C-terminal domain-domain-containing protein n=1 Tax=Naematelia encephala TaxID=71784 RepID=A0A1Y2BJB4_9TREE|nr:or S-antigen, C-terminal domain-domain-containing protein [Naematelia encephala]
MVKAHQPLQIRLTEPVIFLKGPSTGLDFRGRPQTVRQDAQPAMLRGLLTLRLGKPTRIRSIVIRLEGKARTEWPEGIGARRMDTHEEHVIISETTTYFSAKHDSPTRSRSARRAASLGPGVSLAQWDLDEDVIDDELDLQGVPAEGEDMGDWVGVNMTRGRPEGGRSLRSASAMPGTHDSSHWHRDGFSRRPSFTDDRDALGLNHLALRDTRGPSPAYTPNMPTSVSRRSSLRTGSSSTAHEPVLSPIVSAANSRRGSERDDSTETQLGRRGASSGPGSLLIDDPLSENVPWEPRTPAGDPTLRFSYGLEGNASESRSILRPASTREPSGEVRFDTAVRGGEEAEPQGGAPTTDSPLELERQSAELNRAASIRTTSTNFSASSLSLSGSSGENHSAGEVHPISAAIQPTSGMSTTHNSPAPSAAPSIINESIRRPSISSNSISSGPREDETLVTPDTSRQGSLSSAPREAPRTLRQTRTASHASTIVEDLPTILPSAGRSGSFTLSSRPSLQHLRPDSSGKSETSEDSRGRHHHKFSLSAALRNLSSRGKSKSRSRQSSVAETNSRTPSIAEPMPGDTSMSRVGSGSAIPPHLRQSTRRVSGGQSDFIPPYGRGGAGSVPRDSSRERTLSPVGSDDRSESRGRGRHKGMKVLTGKLGLDHTDAEEDVHNWKEFRKGTYNYPISFPIPVDAPPSIHAEFGSVTYRLKATVIRVGALTPNLVEEVEVMMIASPQEDDLEESENVIVERQWEEQMRYQIALSGKAFPIGGTIPISVRLMPLAKCRIHRLTVSLEEKTDYFAQDRKVARHETPKKYMLLFIKQPEKLERIQPLLPILSDDPNAAKDSPLAPLAIQAARNNPPPDAFDVDGDEDAMFASMYASLLDPLGPWHLEKTLTVPDCASSIRFTTKHAKTNIQVSHWLKVTIRVERGDNVAVDTKGRRKQFDIIIETPIKILDCRVNPQWNSLPTYTPQNPSSQAAGPGICSIHGNGPRPAAIHSTHRAAQFDPLVAAAAPLQGRIAAFPVFDGTYRDSSNSRSRDRRTSEGMPANLNGAEGDDSLLERNITYDRLMSGQVTVTGETPPTYVEAMASRARTQSRSRSRLGREGRGNGEMAQEWENGLGSVQETVV